MRLGLQISSFTWPGGDAEIGPTLSRVARTADEVGFDSIWVMDHFFQIRSIGRLEDPMLEGFSALAYMAAQTRRATLGLLVGGIHYRRPGLWIKAVTTLDVLSGGRAWFGIGAAWNVEESRALGFPMPVLADRFGLLEETLQMAHLAWRGERGSETELDGRHVQAERIMVSPQPLTRPRPPILVGGGGERKTLRLAARYADACNVFGGPDVLRHKYEVLRRHCLAVGRDYGTIERTNLATISLTPDGRRGSLTPSALVDRLGGWAEAGSQHTILSIRDVWDTSKLELVGRDVLPQVRSLGDPSPVPWADREARSSADPYSPGVSASATMATDG